MERRRVHPINSHLTTPSVCNPSAAAAPGDRSAMRPVSGVAWPSMIAWWFGIYFAAQLPLISVIAAFYLFPTGLFRPLFPPDGDSPSAFFVIVLPYMVYLVHLIASLNVRSKTTYQILLVVLVVMVVLNLVGCESMLDGLHNIH